MFDLCILHDGSLREPINSSNATYIKSRIKLRPAPKKDQNSYDADYAALSPLQVILAIVVVHHVRKMESDDPLDTVSGTTGLTGAADSILVLNRDSQGTTLYGRGRDISEVETAMQFEPTTGRWTVLGAAQEVRRSDERNLIMKAVAESDGPLGPSDIAAVTGMKDQNVRFLPHQMVTAGEIGKEGRARYIPITTLTS